MKEKTKRLFLSIFSLSLSFLAGSDDDETVDNMRFFLCTASTQHTTQCLDDVVHLVGILCIPCVYVHCASI